MSLQLLILFGIPCVVLLIAFAFNDPASLAVAVPLALLVPGPRDVLLAVASDMLRGMNRAARFVSTDEVDLTAEADELLQAQRHARAHQAAAAAQHARQQPSWGRRVPPPPPPPPVVSLRTQQAARRSPACLLCAQRRLLFCAIPPFHV